MFKLNGKLVKKSHTRKPLLNSSYPRIAIVGAGAAGLFTAALLAETGLGQHVDIFEKTRRPAAKILISGGGRCNVTHNCFTPQELVKAYPRGHKELLGCFGRFQPKDMIQWLNSKGVELKTEEDGRIFPISDRSQDIASCLLDTCEKGSVGLHLSSGIDEIKILEKGFKLIGEWGEKEVDYLIMSTGSQPSGLRLAQSLGHNIISSVPSLFSFHLQDFSWKEIAGVSALASVKLSQAPWIQSGPLLVTHWGFSGPAILKLSSWAARHLHELQYKETLIVDWLPEISLKELEQHLLDAKKENIFLYKVIPTLSKSLTIKLLTDIDQDPEEKTNRLSDKACLKIATGIKKATYPICGQSTHKQEFVTCGGVDLKEIDFRSFQSKIHPGLFFAGELLNIDAITGGFNFQNAWTGGWHIAKFILEENKNFS